MFNYTGSGLDGIFLKNGYKIVESSYGQGVIIEDIEGLHRAIAIDIIRQKTPMTGNQFRFLRKEQDLVQEEMAALLRVDVQTIANWEKKGNEAIQGPADISMRAFYSAFIHASFGPAKVEPCAKTHERTVFQLNEHKWTEAIAA
ncbi:MULTISPECIES: helix-turn-helix domain-containing protein [unclassified Pseudomonas]|uniref:helix-turn-helix domain-containing protein n=1 Tax=unclassified Pseudomonas TaxID=196821 RepID=UPI001CBD4D36|nr:MULTISPECIES: transcriptional regulator [unclassified Pseudomonas]MEB2514817.1 transcriptional regulator [Pseudomonas sp. YuFO20]